MQKGAGFYDLYKYSVFLQIFNTFSPPGLKWAVTLARAQMNIFRLLYPSFLCLIKGAQLLLGVGYSRTFSSGLFKWQSLRDKSKLGWACKLFSTTTLTPAITSSVCHSTWSDGGARTTTFVLTQFLISILWGIMRETKRRKMTGSPHR